MGSSMEGMQAGWKNPAECRELKIKKGDIYASAYHRHQLSHYISYSHTLFVLNVWQVE